MSTVVNLSTLGAGGFVIQGDNPGDQAGFSVSTAGDFNHDGFDDIIIGAPFNDSGATNSGAAYLIYGHVGGFGTVDLGNLQPAQGFRITQDRANDTTGMSVSAAGDVNGDGFDDIVVGAAARGLLGYGFNLGAWVIFGTASPPQAVNLIGLTPAQGFAVFTDTGTSYTGTVAAAGDFNGDGFADIVLGSPADGPSHFGAAYVVFGKASGLGSLHVSNLGSNGFIINGNGGLFDVGRSVSQAGDVNGDGFDDLIVSAVDSGFYHYGSAATAYVVFGKASGFPTVDLSALPPSDGFAIRGQYFYGVNKFSVASAGDINGDGFADIVVGTSYDYGVTGSAYVIFGKASGLDTINVTALTPSTGFAIHSNIAQDLGGFTVSGAGDVNGDGLDDLLVGVPGADSGGADAGDALVIFGHTGGFAAIDLQNVAPADGFILHGQAAGARVGASVSSAGDVNGDGSADLLVGAPLGALGGVNAGQAYVIFGSASLLSDASNDFNGDHISDFMWRDADGRMSEWLGTQSGGFQWNAPGGFQVGTDWSMLGFGDFNGDHRDDILWRQSGSGTVQAWLGQGSGSFAWSVTYALPTSQQFAALGDFNGDGHEDVMWRLADGTLSEWTGQGNGGFSWNPFGGFQVSNDWKVIGAGDFDGDSHDDLLWRQDGTGTVMEWLGNAQGGFAWNVNFNLSPNSHFVGTGDFNGDSVDDIMWRGADGTLAEWLGQGNGGFQWNPNAAFHVSNDWQVVGIGDYNGDGSDDMMWETNTGEVYQWLAQTNGTVSTFVWNQPLHYEVATTTHAQPIADHFL